MAAELGAPDATAVADLFDLGRVTRPLTAVAGAYSHRVWHLSTVRGRFAVKELNRDFTDPSYLDRYEAACGLELTMINSGIEAPRPVLHPQTGRACAELCGASPRPTTVRVHEWINGEPLHSAPASAHVTKRIGALLARIHALELPTAATVADVLGVRGARYWRHLCERVSAADLDWSPRLREALPVVQDLESQVDAARSSGARLIVTHRDLSPGNVILTPTGLPVAVDWDWAGPMVPAFELASAVVHWSNSSTTNAHQNAARALVDGYTDAGGSLPEGGPEIFAGMIAQGLAWLDICVRRALGERAHSTEHRHQAEEEAGRVLNSLPSYLPSLEKWARWLKPTA